jgi:hypothetical protein
MDAVRLVESMRHALKGARGEQELLAEAWEAQALAEAVVGRLLPDELRPTGPPGTGRSAPRRAAMLTGVREPATALRDLRDLLSELGVVLVSAACSVEDESLYWQCIEALDAAADSRDHVCALLRDATTGGDRQRSGT